MARLIHLNGPSRVGKSTLAHRYAGNEASDLTERIRGHLAEYLHGRPDTILLDTTGLSIDQTYAHLMNLLDT